MYFKSIQIEFIYGTGIFWLYGRFSTSLFDAMVIIYADLLSLTFNSRELALSLLLHLSLYFVCTSHYGEFAFRGG